MNIVKITILRDEKYIPVWVDMRAVNIGSMDPRVGFHTDDPPVIEAEDFGVTEDGKKIELFSHEVMEAEEAYW